MIAGSSPGTSEISRVAMRAGAAERQHRVDVGVRARDDVHRDHLADALGREVATRDANGNVNGQTYDAAGNVATETHADGGVITHRYNAFGDVVSTVDAMGGTITLHSRPGEGSRFVLVLPRGTWPPGHPAG